MRGTVLLTAASFAAAAAAGARVRNDCVRAKARNDDINDPLPDWDVRGVSEMNDLFNADKMTSKVKAFGKQGSQDDVSRWARL